MRTKLANMSNISNSVYNPLGFSFVFNWIPVFEEKLFTKFAETGSGDGTDQLIRGELASDDVDDILDYVNIIPGHITVPAEDD